MSGQLQAVTFNVWSGQHPDALRRNLLQLVDDVGHPEVLALQEAKRYRGALDGYERVAIDVGHPENANCVLLIRKRGVRIVREPSIEPDGPSWIGPKHGLRHPARKYPAAVLEVDGCDRRFEAVAVHRTPGGPSPHIKVNGESWEAEHHAIVEYVDRRTEAHPDRPIGLLADWNDHLTDRQLLSLRHLASEIEAQALIPTGKPAIDGVLLVNCHGRAQKLPDKYGSDDHRPVVVTITL